MYTSLSGGKVNIQTTCISIVFTTTLSCRAVPEKTTDNDGDGYESSIDCDDNNPSMPELDQDCDGTSTDLDCDDFDETSTTKLTDEDCDGILTENDCNDVDPTSTIVDNDADCDGILTDDDCDDSDSTILSSANDADCDGYSFEEDCNDNDPQSTHVENDADCDGAETETDCDDNDPNVMTTTELSASESFTQGTNQTDIVLAVDTSCSMYDDIYNMSLTFSTFVDFLHNNNQDFQISAVVDDSGCVNGNVTHIDQTFSTSDAVSAFQDMLTYTQWASNAERPFMLMEAFLNEAVDSSGTPLPSGCNYGAIRPGARLALLGVADEPDQSIEPYTHYISEFQALKSNPDDVTFYSLGPLCYYNGYTHMENAALDTNGAIYDICTSVVNESAAHTFWTDFGTDLLSYGNNSVFELSAQAAASINFSVTINGQIQTSGWSYDSSINSIVFNTNSIPPMSSIIEVTYSWTECL